MSADKLPLEINKDTAKKTQPRRRHVWLRHLIILICLIVIFAIGGLVGMIFQPPGLKFVMRTFNLEPGSGTSAPIAVSLAKLQTLQQKEAQRNPDDVVGLGTILPMSDIITIAPPYGAGDARIDNVLVQDGEVVRKNQLLATLDSLPELEAKVQAAFSKVNVMQAALKQSKTSVAASLAEAKAVLAKDRAKAINASNEYHRIEQLYAKDLVSKSLLDQRLAEKEQARESVEQALANLSRYSKDNLNQQVDIEYAKQNLLSAKSDLQQSRKEKLRGEVRAPSAGTILDIHVQSGEKSGDDGILTMANLQHMKVEVDVYQTSIGSVKVGDKVVIKAPSIEQQLHGKVIRIGKQVRQQKRVADSPTATTDARVVEVTVKLDKQSSKIAANFTNMQVVATIIVS